MVKTWKSGWWLGLAMAATGCADSSGGDDEAGPRVEVRALTAQLVKAESCDDLLGEIQADAVARVDLAATRIREAVANGGFSDGDSFGRGFNGGFSSDASGPVATPGAPGAPAQTQPPVGGGTADPAPNPAPPVAPGNADSPGQMPAPGPATQEVNQGLGEGDDGNENVGPDGVSDTNRQVAEVDEADLVKVDADGERVYLLHGDKLVVLKSWPAAETSLSQEVTMDGPLDGRPYEMFVKDGKVAVFSSVRDSSVFRDAAGDPLNDRPPLATPPVCPGCYYEYSDQSYTKVTLLDFNGAAPAVTRELYFEGTYISSRRYDNTVRAIIRGGFRAPRLYEPNIELYDAWGNLYADDVIDDQVKAWRARTVRDILATDLDDWLPQRFQQASSGVEAIDRACGEYFIPAPGLVNYGLTQVVELDMAAADGALGGASILGDAAQVYSNSDAMLLAHSDWRFSIDSRTGEQRTVLHQFGLSPDGISYVASGYVGGTILNQFSMNEQDGVVAVTTTAQTFDGEFDTDNRLRTLRADGNDLKVIGETPNLGKPRETIRSTRFVGDRAYVVTFEQIDPLVVVDLQDPTSPTVLGQVEIPGFSSYMHPLGDDHLLTIGEFIDPVTGGNRSLQLQIFDVSDPTMPQQAHSHVFPLGGSSLAQQQHKAFNYFADRKLLAFPYVNWNEAKTSLEVFRIDATAGITPVGSVDHTGLLGNCMGGQGDFPGGPVPAFPGADVDPTQLAEWEAEQARRQTFYACPGQSVRRGVFIDDYVLSFSYGGVLVHAVSDLSSASSEADATARVDLPSPSYGDWFGNGGFGGGFIGGPAFGGVGVTQPGVPRPPVEEDVAIAPPIPMETPSGAPEDAENAEDADGGMAVGDMAVGGAELEMCVAVCGAIVQSCGADTQACEDECLQDFEHSDSCGEGASFLEMLDCCAGAAFETGCDASFDACQREACGDLRPAGAADGC